MAIPLYLAMTAADFSACRNIPLYPAYMSCHFSPGGQGLSNIPAGLPQGCLLILDDQLPPSGHDPGLIRSALESIITSQNCAGLLLDFQRPNNAETGRMATELLRLPCPVCVSHLYAEPLSCPVLIPPCRLTVPLKEHLAPWQGREIWLETAPDSAAYRITEKGCEMLSHPGDPQYRHYDPELFCRYGMETEPAALCFSLCRTKEDLPALLQAAETLGTTAAIGMYREFFP